MTLRHFWELSLIAVCIGIIVTISVTPVVDLAIGALLSFFLQSCATEKLSEARVMSTSWLAIASSRECGIWPSDGGPEEIIVTNSEMGESMVLARGEHSWETHLESHKSGELVIVLPNKDDILPIGKPPAGVDVIYSYTPYDDPEYRNSYRLWYSDPKNPSNIAWFCSHLFLEYPAWQRESVSRQYAPFGVRTDGEYCPSQPKNPDKTDNPPPP